MRLSKTIRPSAPASSGLMSISLIWGLQNKLTEADEEAFEGGDIYRFATSGAEEGFEDLGSFEEESGEHGV